MNVTIIVPSDEYRSSAGVRIRYKRIAPVLTRQGIDLNIESIARFDPATADADTVLISKCHDARSLIVAAALSQRGKLVGVDLFDDYFSDRTDSRLLRYRAWLRQLVRVCDFALCSTRPMAKVAQRYRKDLATFIMNDPAPDLSLASVAGQLARKLEKARDQQRIDVVWFGLGDNPSFRVGLADLSAYGTMLGELGRSGMTVALTILTNRRALTTDGLSLINDLPIATEIREWSESAEEGTLRDALVAFLPVSAQPFSTAKSLNRAITALSAGCQVISAGYPLYAALDPLIYRSPGEFLADLVGGKMRASRESIGEYRKAIEHVASANTEGQGLGAFLMGLPSQAQRRRVSLTVVHGHSTRPEVHSLVRSVDGLSVASPYCGAALDFDVVFRGSGSGLKMLVAQRSVARVLPEMRSRLKRRERIRGEQFLGFSNGVSGLIEGGTPATEWDKNPIPFQLATYSGTMDEIERRMVETFGPSETILSEASQLPFRTDGRVA